MDYRVKIHRLISLIHQAGKVLALTGAGISTESGIPDFRSRNGGLWVRFDPAEIASVQALKRDPATFYRFHLPWWQTCLKAAPNVGHKALAQLEKAGWLLGVITQNIDGLHQAAGSQRVWEVHGHLRNCHCLGCGQIYELKQLYQSFFCTQCGNLLRPQVVLFGDPMPPDYFTAEKVLSGCQLLLIIGSSMQVQPVANLPALARQVVIVNREATPWDDYAELVFHESAGQVLKDLVAGLQGKTGPYFFA
nr:NAD-dependent deacylase [Desulforamulus hydrothermalis]